MERKKGKKLLSLVVTASLMVTSSSVLTQAAVGEEGKQQMEIVEIGSDVWSTPVIPDVPKQQAGVKQSEISLNETTGDGTWKYLYDIPDDAGAGGVPSPTAENQDFDFSRWENKNWQNIKVPGEALMQGFDILANNEYYYQREITIPEDFKGKRVLVRFDGVYCNARVWANGNFIRTHAGGFTTWDCDITDYAKAGESITLTVGVADLYGDTKGIWNPDGDFLNNPSNASWYAHHSIGGINRDVSLVALPYDCIARTYVNTDFDETFTDASLEVTSQLQLQSERASLLVELLDGEETVASGTAEFTRQKDNSGLSQAKKLTIPVKQPRKWDAEHPNLYTLRSTLTVDGESVQVNEEKIGFREIYYGGMEGTDRNKVYVNGMEVKLRGTCRHDVSDDLGRSMTREECYAEARAYKNANINHIRTSHYPVSEDLLDACDELGIYVEQETAVCFQGYPDSTVSSKYEDYLPQFTEMIERDRNRPSILIWSLGNESNYEYIKNQSGGNAIWDERTYLKDVDASRPCIYSWPDTAPYETADIYSQHYAYVEGNMGAWDRPILHDEYAHISCYNLDELQRDVNVRNFWGESVKKAWENIFTTDGALGGDLWGGIDDVFYIPDGTTERWQVHSDGQTAGYGEWGSVLDAYLREKPEAYLTKKAYSPVRVDEEACYISEGTLYMPVKNWFDHTNLNELTMLVTVDGIMTEYQVAESIIPHSQGVITVPGITENAESVNLKFYTADGIMVDEYNIQTAEVEYYFTPAGNTAPETEDTVNELLVTGDDFSVRFDKKTGLISQAMYQDKTLITGGPYLHVTGMELGTWTPDSSEGVAAKIVDHYAVVTLKGSYANGQRVQFELKISGNGIIITDYTLLSSPAVGSGLKEVGISYDIPSDVESVSWLRDGLYSAYPDDHIGRSKGTAPKIRKGSAETPDQYGVEPAWSWKDDMKNYFVYSTDDPNNGLVTNDFKTMRENIRYYTVNYGTEKDAPRISVESGKTDAAARVDVSYERVFVDDRDAAVKYSGSWGTYETESDYAGTETYSTQQGAACEFRFYGTGVRYIGAKQKNTGLVKVYIDNELKETIDTYSNLGNEMKQSVVYSVQGLTEGAHTIRLETAGGNADCIVVDAFEVLNASDTGASEKARLIINNQWYYPNLGWGNYTGNQGTLYNGSKGSATIRLCAENTYNETVKASLSGLKLAQVSKDEVKAVYELRNGDEKTEVKLQWYRLAVGDPDSKVQLLEGENGETLNISDMKAYRVYYTAALLEDGQEVDIQKSSEMVIGEDSYTYYDILADSELFVFEGTKGTDYQTDVDEDWTQNAYEKTVTYLLDTKNPASITFTFEGRGIRWIGAKENNQGIAEVTVDGGETMEVDLCDPDVQTQKQVSEILFEKGWDGQGTHTITIKRTGKKNEKAAAANISLDAFLVISYENENQDKPVKPDNTELQNAVAHAKEKDLGGYTEESANVYRKALQNAERILTNENASQKEIDAALKELRAAEEGLKIKTAAPPADNKKTVPAAGKTYDVSGILRYKVTKSSATGGSVTVVKLLKKNKTKVVIPATVKLDGYTFKVTAISANAFKDCKGLKSVTIGANVTSIGKQAFYKCRKLKTIIFKRTKAPKIGKQAFKGIQAKCMFTVPKKMAKKQFDSLKTRLKKAGIGKKAVYKKK
ncbi:MAG: glycoside hydrolase family 2 TIM barrel-domain containing protein [Hominisplanchenecus sp.]